MNEKERIVYNVQTIENGTGYKERLFYNLFAWWGVAPLGQISYTSYVYVHKLALYDLGRLVSTCNIYTCNVL